MTNIRTLAPIAALALVVAFSVIATASSGTLTAVASPLLIVAIALAFWHDGAEANTKTGGDASTSGRTV